MEISDQPEPHVHQMEHDHSRSSRMQRRFSLDSVAIPQGLGQSLSFPRRLSGKFRFSTWGRRSSSVVETVMNLGVLKEGRRPSLKRRGSSSGNGGCVLAIVDFENGEVGTVTGENETKVKEFLASANMEGRISSYRLIMASTRAILNSESSVDAIGDGLGDVTEEGADPAEGLSIPSAPDARFKHVYDLYRSERQFVHQLRSVLDTYAEPLRKFSSLSKEDHRVLFVGLEPIVSLSGMLISKLEDSLKSWDQESTQIGSLFSSKFWNHFDEYCDKYQAIKLFLDEKYESDEHFLEFCELRRGNSSQSLGALLYLPVQRIPEYDKYLNELLEETDSSHPDFEDLSRAAAKVRNMVKEREDELGNMDNQRRMERVQEKFPNDDLKLRDLDSNQKRSLSARRKSAPGAVLFKTLNKSKSTGNLLSQGNMGKKDWDLLRPTKHCNLNRQYLMEGPVEFSRGMQNQDRYLFLFSDLLLVAKQKSSTTFKLKHRVRVCELWITFCVDDVSEITRPSERSFVIGWPTTNYVATFKSLELKETWLNKLKEQIQEEKLKDSPKTVSLEVLNKEIEKACFLDVNNTTEARDVVKKCLEEFQLTEAEAKDYQLWVKIGNDESPYPLIGHELPYAIKLGHIRDLAKNKNEDATLNELDLNKIMADMQTNRKYEFFLKHSKKSPKKHSLEESSGSNKLKKSKKSPLINLFRRSTAANRDEKKPQGKLFGYPLTEITTAENPIPKPVMELLTILFREAPYTVGILRKSPNAKLCRELRQRLDDGEDCLSNEVWPSLVIGALLKEFLRNIPQSLMYDDMFEEWIAANEMTDAEEKVTKIKQILTKLPPCHYQLLGHVMCILYHIDKKSDENMMTAYNLSVCIAPSLLWEKGKPDPLATPAAVVQFMIENCVIIFGRDMMEVFGDPIEQKMRQDSSTDSDSMHSVLSTHSGMRRDDSSIDSLEREMLYTGEMDSSPQLMKSHLSPSNLSRDSGLTLSDSQLYDEDSNMNEVERRNYTRSASQCIERYDRPASADVSRSLEHPPYFYTGERNPVPPPRKSRKKGSEPPHGSPNLESPRKPRYLSHVNMNIGGRYEKSRNAYTGSQSDRFRQFSKRSSSESLKSVEEGSEGENSSNRKDWRNRQSELGTLVKSSSGAHLYFEEFNSNRLYEFETNLDGESHRHPHFSSLNDSTPPMSPESKYSLSSSRDSVLSDSSAAYIRQYGHGRNTSPPQTPDSDQNLPPWMYQGNDIAFMDTEQRHYSQDDSELGLKSGRYSSEYESKSKPKSSRASHYLVSPSSSPRNQRKEPIHMPLGVRHSFPMKTETLPVGSGSNTSKEAEDIINSPKISVTYCSNDSLNKMEEDLGRPRSKSSSPHLHVYTNSSDIPLKDINKYSAGLQGTSPPPKVVLQGLSQKSERRDNTPMKASHDSAIVSQVRRHSLESGQMDRRITNDDSVSSESEESDSEDESSWHYSSEIRLPCLNFSIPQKRIVQSPPASSEKHVIGKNSSPSQELKDSAQKAESPVQYVMQPPSYQEAVKRNYMIKHGIPLEISDTDSQKQKEISARAKQLYEQSLRQYQERETKYSPPSQQFEVKLGVVGEHQEEERAGEVKGVEEKQTIQASIPSKVESHPEKNPKRLYEESLKRFMQEQSKERQNVVKTSSNEEEKVASQKGPLKTGDKTLLSVSGLHRSLSDVQDFSSKREVWRTRRSPQRSPQRDVSPSNSSNDSTPTPTPTKRPEQPPPYADPPPYKRDKSESSPVGRHTFATAGGSAFRQSNVEKANQASVLQAYVRKLSMDSARSRDSSVESNRSSQSVIENPRYRDLSSDKVQSRDTSVEPKYSRDSSLEPKYSRDTPKSSQSNARTSKSLDAKEFFTYRTASAEVNRTRKSSVDSGTENTDISSFDRERSSSVDSRTVDSKVMKSSISKSGARDLPWSVKHLRNLYDASKDMENSEISRTATKSSTPNSSSSSLSSHRHSTPPPYNHPPPFYRQNDTRSSASSSSSTASANTSRNAGHYRNSMVNKFGPQARDSFSSSDGSDCSCRHSLHRADHSSSEDLDNWSFTDISYV